MNLCLNIKDSDHDIEVFFDPNKKTQIIRYAERESLKSLGQLKKHEAQFLNQAQQNKSGE